MRPTKRTEVHRIKPELSKLKKLMERITAMIEKVGEDHKQKANKDWVIEEIDNLKNGGWLTAVKMKVANEMWSKYGG